MSSICFFFFKKISHIVCLFAHAFRRAVDCNGELYLAIGLVIGFIPIVVSNVLQSFSVQVLEHFWKPFRVRDGHGLG